MLFLKKQQHGCNLVSLTDRVDGAKGTFFHVFKKEDSSTIVIIKFVKCLMRKNSKFHLYQWA